MAGFHMNLRQTGEANRSDGYTQYQRCRLRSSSAWLKKVCNLKLTQTSFYSSKSILEFLYNYSK